MMRSIRSALPIQRNRPVENKTIGIRIEDPNVDFGAMARTYGCWGAGPITEPKDLIKTLREAVKVVKEGKPALVDRGMPDEIKLPHSWTNCFCFPQHYPCDPGRCLPMRQDRPVVPGG